MEPKMPTPSVVYFGASRGSGFQMYTAVSSRRPDIHNFLFVRNVDGFKSSKEYATLSRGLLARTTIVRGDAWSEEDVRNLLEKASGSGYTLETVISAIGPDDPSSAFKKILRGIVLKPNDPCTRALIVLLTALKSLALSPQFVYTSSFGVGAKAAANHNMFTRFIFSYYLSQPFNDKIACELLLERSFTHPPPAEHSFFPAIKELPLSVISVDAFNSAVAKSQGTLDPAKVVLIHPPGLEDGPAKETNLKVAQDGVGVKGRMGIRRADLGQFVAGLWGPEGEKWWGAQVVFQR